MGTLTTILSIAIGTLPLTQYLGRTYFAIWVWLCFFTASGTFSVMPTAVAKSFGEKNYSINYGMIFVLQVSL